MSRNDLSTPASSPTPGPSGLMPLDAPQAENAPSGGVFRLEALAPGVVNAEQAMAAPRKRKVSTQAIALGILLALGGGLIYGMRLLGMGPLTTLAKTVLPDYDLSKPYSHASDHQKILQDLAANHAASQVPVDDVQKNPFKLSEGMASTPSTPTTTGTPHDAQRAMAEKEKREAEVKRNKIHSALASLKINGVIGGSNPVARISGEAVRIGDTIGEAPAIFTVKAIQGRTVALECDGETYELHMDDDGANSTKSVKKK